MMIFKKPTVIVCGINADEVPCEAEEKITVRECEKDEITDLLNEISTETLIVSEDVFTANREAVTSAECRTNVIVITDRTETEVKTCRSVEDTRGLIFAVIVKSKEQERIFFRTMDILNEFGITSNLKGKTYLRQAICNVVKDKNLIHCMMKGLYSGIAKDFGITVSKTERCIRFAIQTGWDRTTPEIKKKYFGSLASWQTAPTNSEFIANIAEYISYNK